MFKFMFNIFLVKYVTTIQSNCKIFFKDCFGIPPFFKNVNVHIYKTPSLVYMEVISGLKELEVLVTFFVCVRLVETLWCM